MDWRLRSRVRWWLTPPAKRSSRAGSTSTRRSTSPGRTSAGSRKPRVRRGRAEGRAARAFPLEALVFAAFFVVFRLAAKVPPGSGGAR